MRNALLIIILLTLGKSNVGILLSNPNGELTDKSMVQVSWVDQGPNCSNGVEIVVYEKDSRYTTAKEYELSELQFVFKTAGYISPMYVNLSLLKSNTTYVCFLKSLCENSNSESAPGGENEAVFSNLSEFEFEEEPVAINCFIEMDISTGHTGPCTNVGVDSITRIHFKNPFSHIDSASFIIHDDPAGLIYLNTFKQVYYNNNYVSVKELNYYSLPKNKNLKLKIKVDTLEYVKCIIIK